MRFLIAFGLSLFACSQGPGPAVAPPPTPTPVAQVAPDVSDASAAESTALAAVGEACSTSADCESAICEGLGCGDRDGVCASKERMCTMDLAPYCGCDGQTFHASSGCPGRRFRARGECGAAGQPVARKPAGASCNDGSECDSGMCEGGCGSNDGFCVSNERICTRDLRPYCGCDGVTFYGSGTCPNRRFSARAPCNPGDLPPGSGER